MRSVKGDHSISVSNLLTICDLKKKYLEACGDATLRPEQLRLFCLGKELKDEMCLYSYDIIDEMTIQAMIKK